MVYFPNEVCYLCIAASFYNKITRESIWWNIIQSAFCQDIVNIANTSKGYVVNVVETRG